MLKKGITPAPDLTTVERIKEYDEICPVRSDYIIILNGLSIRGADTPDCPL
jgi:hypothetical protein